MIRSLKGLRKKVLIISKNYMKIDYQENQWLLIMWLLNHLRPREDPSQQESLMSNTLRSCIRRRMSMKPRRRKGLNSKWMRIHSNLRLIGIEIKLLLIMSLKGIKSLLIRKMKRGRRGSMRRKNSWHSHLLCKLLRVKRNY